MRQVIIFETDHERGLAAEALANEWLIAHPTIDVINVSLAVNQHGSGLTTHQSICVLYDVDGFDLAMETLRH